MTDRATPATAARPNWLFVTGKLAAPALRRLLAELAPRAGFDFDVLAFTARQKDFPGTSNRQNR